MTSDGKFYVPELLFWCLCVKMIEDIKTLREEHVYRAKLAEQAERYDGRSLFLQLHRNAGHRALHIPLFHSSPSLRWHVAQECLPSDAFAGW